MKYEVVFIYYFVLCIQKLIKSKTKCNHKLNMIFGQCRVHDKEIEKEMNKNQSWLTYIKRSITAFHKSLHSHKTLGNRWKNFFSNISMLMIES